MQVEMQQEVLTRLDALAAKLGVAAGQMWDILVRQSWLVSGIMQTAVGAAFVIMAIVGLYFMGTTDDWQEPKPRSVSGVVLAFFGFLFAAILLSQGIPHLINPEYYALKDILGAVR